MAWQQPGGGWRYPDYYDLRDGDTVTSAELDAMMTDRFVDHPRVIDDIKHLALPLQEVGVVMLGNGCRVMG